MTKHTDKIIAYYSKRESRWGYQAILGGTRHFGYYERDTLVPRIRPALRRMEVELATTLGLADGALVLDAGCGEGQVAAHLSEEYSLQVIGVDLVEESIRKAKVLATQSSRQLHFEVADYTNLPFPSDTFDGIYTMETLVHAEDYSAALNELYRVLKPGGRLVSLEYSMLPRSELSAREVAAFEAINNGSAMASFGRFTYGQFPKILHMTGFEGAQVLDATIRIRPMLRLFWLLGIVPYAICAAIGKPGRFVNVLAGVELYRMRDKWQYNIISATKPL